jgi:hypothetical protein
MKAQPMSCLATEIAPNPRLRVGLGSSDPVPSIEIRCLLVRVLEFRNAPANTCGHVPDRKTSPLPGFFCDG